MASLHRFVDASRPLVFAHRGGSGLAPENTLAAFDHGLSLGAEGLELDVHLSRDGHVVVHHDERLERTTNGAGPIAACSVEELAELDAGYRFCRDGDFPFRGRGFSVPALGQVLDRYPQARIIIELKNGTEALARATLEDVRKANALDRVCFGSEHVSGLRVIRALEPGAATSAAREEIRRALYRAWLGWPIGRRNFVAFQVPEVVGAIRIVSPRFVRAAHRAGLVVQVWTVDRAEDIRRLLQWGVDGIISDRPDVAVATLREWMGRKAQGSGLMA
jgi:glycerophosphoryl diester phosphodiesterase